MKLIDLFGGPPVRKRLKKRAHAYTMASVVWLFFSAIGFVCLVTGWLDISHGRILLGIVLLGVQGLLALIAIYYWRYEKPSEVDFYETNGEIG